MPTGLDRRPSSSPKVSYAVVVHGATATLPRPAAEVVLWIGSVAPNNWTAQDEWRDNS